MSWSRRWFKLSSDQTLSFYKDENCTKASGIIDLSKTLEVENVVPEVRVKKEHCFMIKVLEVDRISVSHYLVAESDKSRLKWLKKIRSITDGAIEKNKELNEGLKRFSRDKNKKTPRKKLTSSRSKGSIVSSQPASPRPPRSIRSRSESFSENDINSVTEEEESDDNASPSQGRWWVLGNITKTVLTKVVVSRLGKRLLRDWVSPDGISFLVIMRDIIGKQTSSQIEAETFEHIVLKTFTDVIMLISNKSIPKERVLLTRDPIFQLWSDALDMLEISFVFDVDRLITAMDLAWHSINTVIFPHVEIDRRDQLDKFSTLLRDKDFRNRILHVRKMAM